MKVDLGKVGVVPARGEFKNTESFSTNALLKVFHSSALLKEKGMKVWLDEVRPLVPDGWILEDTGYLTFKDLTKLQKIKPPKPTKNDEPMIPTQFKDFFDEIVPFEGAAKREYTVSIEKAVFTDEKFKIFLAYEQSIHKKEDKSKSGFKNFLCDSPLYDPAANENLPKHAKKLDDYRELKPESVWPSSLGSYHMMHRIDGELFMVGVLDLTDTCASSVYLYYDPKYEALSPGTMSAIREIEYVRKCMTIGAPETFQWYYMGYYYQTCQKSVYKANFKPS